MVCLWEKNKQKGFTLLEVSLVIVIIGLLTASVIAGKKLLEASTLKSQILDFRKFHTAYDAFKQQFNALPGDFKDASEYWGAGIPNGNGNGNIALGIDAASNPNSELIAFFYHLSLANLIDETYTNTHGLDSSYPSLKIAPTKGMSAGAILHGNAAGYQKSVTSTFTAGLLLQIGRPTAGGCCAFNNVEGTGTPIIFRSIDLKIDDGHASSGMFHAYRTWQSFYGNCLTAADGDYLITNNRVACQALYLFEE